MGGRISTNQLTYFVREGKKAELEEALGKFPDKINSRNKEGYTVLHEATKLGNLDILNFLITKNADTNVRARETLRTPLHWACELYSLETVHLLLSHGANPNMDEKFTGYAPIHLAVNNGNVEVVRLLKTYNANMNIQDKNGMTPLHLSCKNQDFEMTELLLELGSLPTVTDKSSKTPFDYLSAKLPATLRAWKKKFRKQLKLQSDSPPSSKNSSAAIMSPNSINNSSNGNTNNSSSSSHNNSSNNITSNHNIHSDAKESVPQSAPPRLSITSNTPFSSSATTPTTTTATTTNITIDTNKPPVRNKYSNLYMTTTSTTPTANTCTNITTTATAAAATSEYHSNNFSNSYHTGSTAGTDSYDLYRMDSSVSSGGGIGMSLLSFNGLYPNSSSNSGGDDRNIPSGMKSPLLPPSLNNCGVCGQQFRSFSHHSRKRKTVVPKLLACLHNICEDCLKTQLQHQQDSNNNNPAIPLHVICPHCHEHSPPTVSGYHLNNNFEDYGLLHVHGASSLAPTSTGPYDYADDYFTMYLQELCKSILPIYCSTCREKKNKLNLAHYYCLDCATSTSTTTATSSSPHTSTISPVPSPGASRPSSYRRLDPATLASLHPSPVRVNALLSNDIVPSASEDISLSTSTNTSDTVYFCDMCKYSHEISNAPSAAMSRTSIGSSHHRVVCINNASAASLPHCKHHIDYPYTLYCNNCKVPVCELCRVSARHGSHLFENLTDALEKHVEAALGGNLEKARSLLSDLGVCKGRLESASDALSRQKEIIEAEINTYFDVFKQQLELKRREAIQELMTAYELKNNRINNIKNDITTKITGLETVTDYISRGLHLSSDAYFLHTTTVISSRLQKLVDRGGFNGTFESPDISVAGLLEAKILQAKLMNELKIRCKTDNYSDAESVSSTPPLNLRNSTTGLRGYGPKIRGQYSGYNTISGSSSYSSSNYYTASPDSRIATLSSIYKQEDSPMLQYSAASLNGLPYDSLQLSHSSDVNLSRSNSTAVSPHINAMYSKYNYPPKYDKSSTSYAARPYAPPPLIRQGANGDKNNSEFSKSLDTYSYNKRSSIGNRNHNAINKLIN